MTLKGTHLEKGEVEAQKIDLVDLALTLYKSIIT